MQIKQYYIGTNVAALDVLMSEQTVALKLMLRVDAHTLAERLANHASGDGSGLKGLRLENRWEATIPTWQLANLCSDPPWAVSTRCLPLEVRPRIPPSATAAWA